MNRWRAFGLLVLARLRIFYREPEALFWVYFFPLVMAVGLAVAFWNRPPDPPAVDVVLTDPGTSTQQWLDDLRSGGIRAEPATAEEARRRYLTGKTVLYLIPNGDGLTFGYDPTRSESVSARYHVEAVLRRRQAEPSLRITEQLETEPGNRYIDFLIPGLMGMNILGGGMWGIGFVLVDLRVRKVLKRLVATPMHRGDFLASFLAARLLMLLPEMLSLYVVGRWGFGMPMRGSVIAMAIVMLFGAAASSGMGLLVASRTEKSETVVGLINLLVLPMWLLSGVFFSSKRFPDAAQPFIQALPLTQIIDGLRDVILEGKSLPEIAWRLGILGLYAVVCFTLALRWFRWN
ncbi:MAG: ABC transporter permease [Gemmataceae bacterium]|nr:ABC transporter permease [Gemmataceae bacterium]